MIDLQELVNQAQDLKPLPASVARLVSLVSLPEPPLREIIEVVTLDPGLTITVLRAANSASRGGSSEVTVVADAVVRLGTSALLSVASAAAVKGQMAGPIPQLGLAEGELWRHCVAAALAAEQIRATSSAEVPAEAFTAALLHDIGKLVVARFLDEATQEQLAASVREHGGDHCEAEREIIGADHGELGCLVLQLCGLPPSIATAVMYHHRPERYADQLTNEPRAELLCHVVALAHAAAVVAQGEPPPEEDLSSSRARVGLTDEAWDTLCKRVASQLDETLQRYS